jgi:hypothetical protein
MGLTDLFCPMGDPSNCDDLSWLRALRDTLCEFESVMPCLVKDVMLVPCGTLPADFADQWTDPPLSCSGIPNPALVIEDCSVPILWRWDGSTWTQITQATSQVVWDAVNNSGVTLNVGDIVVRDVSLDNAVMLTNVAAGSLVAGIVTEQTLAGNTGRVCTHGIAVVNVTGTVNRGNYLVTSTTQHFAASDNGALRNVCGVALENAAGGQVLAYINVVWPMTYNCATAWDSIHASTNVSGWITVPSPIVSFTKYRSDTGILVIAYAETYADGGSNWQSRLYEITTATPIDFPHQQPSSDKLRIMFVEFLTGWPAATYQFRLEHGAGGGGWNHTYYRRIIIFEVFN